MKKKILTSTWGVFLGALLCCSLWGSAFPCVKIGYLLFAIPSDAAKTQILFAGLRFLFAGIMVLFFGSIQSRRILLPKKSSFGYIVILSLFQTVLQYIFFYIGLANTTGVKASILVSMNTFLAILLSGLIFHQEKLTARKILGCLLGFAGVVWVNTAGTGMDMNFHFQGEGFVFLSAAASAVSAVCIKKYSQKEDPVVLSGYQFFLGGAVMILAGTAAGGRIERVSAAGIGMLVYLVFISAVAYTLWGVLLKYNPVSKVTVFGFMNPVIGVILSAAILREQEQSSGLVCVLSLILVSAGIWLVNRGKEEEQASGL